MKKQLSFRLTALFLVLAMLFGFAPMDAHAAEPKIRVICVGDSITEGMGASNWGMMGYPGQMQTYLGNNYEVYNCGKSSATLLKKGTNDNKPFSYWDQPQFLKSQMYSADVVIVMLGTNDSKDENWNNYRSEFKQDYIDLVNVYKNLESKPVVLIGTCAYVAKSSWTITDAVIKQQINPIVREVAAETGCDIVDINAVTDGRNDLFNSDGVHPTDTGYTLLAQTFGDKIKSLNLTPGTNPAMNGTVYLTDLEKQITGDVSQINWNGCADGPTEGLIRLANPNGNGYVDYIRAFWFQSNGIKSFSVVVPEGCDRFTGVYGICYHVDGTNDGYNEAHTVRVTQGDEVKHQSPAIKRLTGYTMDFAVTPGETLTFEINDGGWMGWGHVCFCDAKFTTTVDENAAAAQRVTEQIASLGQITLEKESDVAAARDAYEALNEAQQVLVPATSLDALRNAEETLAALIRDAFLPGDVNRNGTVNVVDLMRIKSLILSGAWSNGDLVLADLNQDAVLSVDDILLLRTAILTQN